jgi:hypothetical protein
MFLDTPEALKLPTSFANTLLSRLGDALAIFGLVLRGLSSFTPAISSHGDALEVPL